MPRVRPSPLPPAAEPNAQHSLSQFSTLLNRLLHSAFIVEQQPPQVLKTQTRFAAAARFLVGSKLNLHMDPPEVTVSIVNERQSTQIRQESEAYINGQQINASCWRERGGRAGWRTALHAWLPATPRHRVSN